MWPIRRWRHARETETAFPNYEIAVEDTIAERDLVSVRAKFRGVHGVLLYRLFLDKGDRP